MKISRKLFVSRTLLVYVSIVVAQSDRYKRQFTELPPCSFERLMCFQDPGIFCDSGQCVGVRETDSRECVFVCGNGTGDDPQLLTISEINNQSFVGLDSDPGKNVTNWIDDPAFCTPNFKCQNGGKCSSDFDKFNPQNSTIKCECQDGFEGIHCQTECSLKCPSEGTCVNIEGYQTCACPQGTDPPDCTPSLTSSGLSSQNGSQPIWFIPVLVLFSLIALALSIYLILMKLRWRSLLVTKMFRVLQPYEDDDGKLFDAFISYKSTNTDYSQSEDEKFVLQILQPMLEKQLSYKLCVHYRDFPPGETITSNIMWAVEKSRRTILVLSPLYVQSEWTRLEYEKAQQEMLSLRHKIIPIVFRDISDVKIEDPTLKHILASVTYIEYPKNTDTSAIKKFWSMMQLALPKIRHHEPEADLQPGDINDAPRRNDSLEFTCGPRLNWQESQQSVATDTTEVSIE